jgi:hypothetical protein
LNILLLERAAAKSQVSSGSQHSQDEPHVSLFVQMSIDRGQDRKPSEIFHQCDAYHNPVARQVRQFLRRSGGIQIIVLVNNQGVDFPSKPPTPSLFAQSCRLPV